MNQQAQPVVLAQIIGLPDGSVRAVLMPGLEAEDAKALCNTCIQALAHRQMQFFNATPPARSQILVPKMGFQL